VLNKSYFKRINHNKNLKLYSLTDVNTGKLLQNINVQSNSLEAFNHADVIIDFSRPEGSLKVIALAVKLKKNVVIGTTGFTEIQNKIILKASKKIAIFKSGNMSLGINILEYISKIIAKKMPNNYKVLITDNHHKKKIDYPSGTALMLAGAIAKGKSKKLTSLILKTTNNELLNIDSAIEKIKNDLMSLSELNIITVKEKNKKMKIRRAIFLLILFGFIIYYFIE
jgi:4-hydroxy-tetrahydrodipicolinate reductase